jgi:CheY-like chemotaxis protein
MKRQHSIIFADDDPDYIYLVEQAWQACQLPYQLHTVNNGLDLFEWLGTNSKPDLIFLDVYMPVVNGFDIVKLLKQNGRYESIPIVLLTVSDNQNDMVDGYFNGADGYITKPMTFDALVTQLEFVSHYWVQKGQIPKAE